MVSGVQLVLALIIGIAVLIFLVLATKIHAFFALIISSLVIGIIAGLKFGDVTGAITGGFGGTLGSIGIIIGFGVMMGEIFQFSGAANRMAHTFIKVFGKGKEEWALAATGFLVSIPVFCDSGFVILSPIAKAISRRTKKSMIALGTALAAGLLVTHANVPPTPGPLFVAGQFGVDLGKYILLSLAASVPMVIATTAYAKWLGRRIYQIPGADGEGWERPPYQKPVYAGTFAEEKDMPSAFSAFLPIVLPIILILAGTVFAALKITSGPAAAAVQLTGTPIVAVGIGLFLATYTLALRVPRRELLDKMENGIKSAGIIILVTGGGGALGRVLQTSGIGNYIAEALSKQPIPIFILPFIITTLIRVAQGSGTVAMQVSASICAPILAAAGGNMYLGALAACLGAHFCSYFNDSYFWVTNRLMGVSDTREQLRVWTGTTGVAWAAGLIELAALAVFMKS